MGIDDSPEETWKQSETRLIAFCTGQLGFSLDANNIERAHRLGKFATNKNRPIIVQLSRFKDKELILACGPKLKGTNFAIREDFSAATRVARSKLLQFAKLKKCPFKLRLDRLYVGNVCYIYDANSDLVIESRS